MVINHVSKSWDDPPSGKVQDKLLRAGGFAVEGAKRAAPLLSLPWALGVRAVVPWLKSWATFASGKGIEQKQVWVLLLICFFLRMIWHVGKGYQL